MKDTTRELVGYGLPLAWITVLTALFEALTPVGRFLGATVGLFLAVKLGAWTVLSARSRTPALSPTETLLY